MGQLSRERLAICVVLVAACLVRGRWVWRGVSRKRKALLSKFSASFGAERFDWIDRGGAPRWQITSDERGDDQTDGDGSIRNWVDGVYVEEEGRHQAHDD